jgi:hypothetical protein
MKEVEKKDAPDVSGGGLNEILPVEDYPQFPIGPTCPPPPPPGETPLT